MNDLSPMPGELQRDEHRCFYLTEEQRRWFEDAVCNFSMRYVSKKMGVSDDVAGFVIPLCATIHLSGSMLKIVACSLALMIMQGMEYDFALFAGFVCMLGVTMVAAPGVPGGAIMAALGVLASMLGFTAEDQALMISLYVAMDSFGTACNVTGDGALAIIVDRFKTKQ